MKKFYLILRKLLTKFLLIICVLLIFGCIFYKSEEKPVIKIVTIGDSITKGIRDGVNKSETFSSLLEKMLQSEGARVEVINVGISGERADQALLRLEKDIISINPHIVTIMYGTNDAFIDPGKKNPRLEINDYKSSLLDIVRLLKEKQIFTVIMTEPPLGRFDGSDREPYLTMGPNFLMKDYIEACRQIVSDEKIALVDNFKKWSEYIDKGQAIEEWLSDGFHPNPSGHEIIAKTMFPIVKNQIKRLNNLSDYILNYVPYKPKEYTIPVIDISEESERQITIDKEKGQYLGHPTTVLLEDKKSMVVVYPKGHGRGAVVMKHSFDGGLTWSERLNVPENWATSKEVPTLFRTIDKNGIKRIIMFSGLYPIRMAVSEDNGIKWTPLEPIGNYGGIVAMGDLVRLKNGNYMTFFHDDGRFLKEDGIWTNEFYVYKIVSNDGGLTWNSPEIVIHHNWAHLCEPGLVRSPDAEQLAMLLRENSRKFNSMVIFSEDEGETWSEPKELPASLTGDRHTCRYTHDGRILVVFRDMAHASPTRGDFVGWLGTYDDIVNCNEGQYRIRLLDNKKGTDCGYPGLELLPDGTFIATTYGHWIEGEEPFIKSVRFSIDDMDTKLLSY